jgi:hypothetical protein
MAFLLQPTQLDKSTCIALETRCYPETFAKGKGNKVKHIAPQSRKPEMYCQNALFRRFTEIIGERKLSLVENL